MDRWEIFDRVADMTLTEIMTTNDPDIIALMREMVREIINRKTDVYTTEWVDGVPHPQY